MGKQSGVITLRGRVGDKVYKSGKRGNRVTEAPELTGKQKAAVASRPQNQRTGALNRLASEILKVSRGHAGALVHGNFFTDMLSKFRAETTNHRVLLLQKLVQTDVHPRYQFGNACPRPQFELTFTKTAYTIEAEISAAYGNKECNSFFLEFILMAWNADDDLSREDDLSTDWMGLRTKKPKHATIKIPRKAADTEYLIACRYVGAWNENEDSRYWTSTAMYFIAAGTLTAEGRKILAYRKAEQEAARTAVPVKKEEVVRKRVGVRDEK